MPSLEEGFALLVTLPNAPLFVPLAVVSFACVLLLLAATRKRARERLRRASEIEGRLRD